MHSGPAGTGRLHRARLWLPLGVSYKLRGASSTRSTSISEITPRGSRPPKAFSSALVNGLGEDLFAAGHYGNRGENALGLATGTGGLWFSIGLHAGGRPSSSDQQATFAPAGARQISTRQPRTVCGAAATGPFETAARSTVPLTSRTTAKESALSTG